MKRSAGWIFGAGLTMLVSLTPAANAQVTRGAAIMPPAQQNAVVRKQCGVCHNDKQMAGGLTVQHFDAANPEPSVAAMLISKLTGGLTPQYVEEAARKPDANARVQALLKGGAMGAGGSLPDQPTQVAVTKALAAEAAEADQWHSKRADGTITASIVRQLTSARFQGRIDMYKLAVTCEPDTHQGEIRLSWANGVPNEGTLMSLSIDGNASQTHKLVGSRAQGNQDYGPGATVLYPAQEVNVTMPAQFLKVSHLIADETVIFPFDNLDSSVRRDLAACFSTGSASGPSAVY